MVPYIVRRLLIAIPVLLAITILGFTALKLTPGDPLLTRVNPEVLVRLTDEQLALWRSELGLDQPIPIQYVRWLGLDPLIAIFTGDPEPVTGVLQGDLGYSIVTKRAIVDEMGPRIVPTLWLMLTAFTIALIIGVFVGVVSAVRQYSRTDYALTGMSVLLASTPPFVLGLVAIYFFAVNLRIMPTGGVEPLSGATWFGDYIYHLIMPALILGLLNAAIIARYTRSSMLDVLGSDYMTTARAKGLLNRHVIVRHGLRNGLIPVITLVGLLIPQAVAGAVITEQVFNWPGMGKLAVRAANDRDPSLMMGIILLVGTAVIIGSLVADIGYAIADPRVRYDSKRR